MESYASAPGNLRLSEEKFGKVKAQAHLSILDMIEFPGKKKMTSNHIMYGDTQPAIVVSESPSLIC